MNETKLCPIQFLTSLEHSFKQELVLVTFGQVGGDWGQKLGLHIWHNLARSQQKSSNFEVEQTKVHFDTFVEKKNQEKEKEIIYRLLSVTGNVQPIFLEPFLTAIICPVNTDFLPLNPSQDFVVPYANLSLECLESTFQLGDQYG